MTNSPLTVADLKALLEKLPDDTQLWVFDTEAFSFRPVTDIAHDKRSNGLNFWVDAG